tara:strand:+ start:1381 stop:1707 length:327 start_codon:yes stop_codon:yes gene_type:complete
MTKDQYLRMVEQTGEEIDWERCPPELEDFPDSVHIAINIYHSLGDNIYPEIGFIGKDYTLLKFLYTQHGLENEAEKDWIFELLLHLDAHNVTESQRKIKAEYDKIKKK